LDLEITNLVWKNNQFHKKVLLHIIQKIIVVIRNHTNLWMSHNNGKIVSPEGTSEEHPWPNLPPGVTSGHVTAVYSTFPSKPDFALVHISHVTSVYSIYPSKTDVLLGDLSKWLVFTRNRVKLVFTRKKNYPFTRNDWEWVVAANIWDSYPYHRFPLWRLWEIPMSFSETNPEIWKISWYRNHWFSLRFPKQFWCFVSSISIFRSELCRSSAPMTMACLLNGMYNSKWFPSY